MKHFILLKILIISIAILFFSGFVSSATPVNEAPNGLLLIEYPVSTPDTTAPGEINNMPGNQPDSSGHENLLQKGDNQPAVSFKNTQFKVYPNPGQGIFHLEVNNKTFMQLDFGVFDLTGKEIW